MIRYTNYPISLVARSFKYSIHVNTDYADVGLNLFNDHALGSSVIIHNYIFTNIVTYIVHIKMFNRLY